MSKDDPVCEVWRLGKIGYGEARELQEKLAGELGRGEHPPVLLLLEHPHVYTFGRRGEAKNLLWSAEDLARRGVEVISADRGGKITYHGPGQIVGYPILPLGKSGREEGNVSVIDYVGYVRKIETVIILTLARFGLAGGQIHGKTGVWIQPDVASRCVRCDPRLKRAPSKIASIGVKVDVRGVTRHGFALNVATDPDYWQGIVPCGLDGVEMVNLADLLEPAPTTEEVLDRLEDVFGEVFDFRMVRSANRLTAG